MAAIKGKNCNCCGDTNLGGTGRPEAMISTAPRIVDIAYPQIADFTFEDFSFGSGSVSHTVANEVTDPPNSQNANISRNENSLDFTTTAVVSGPMTAGTILWPVSGASVQPADYSQGNLFEAITAGILYRNRRTSGQYSEFFTQSSLSGVDPDEPDWPSVEKSDTTPLLFSGMVFEIGGVRSYGLNRSGGGTTGSPAINYPPAEITLGNQGIGYFGKCWRRMSYIALKHPEYMLRPSIRDNDNGFWKDAWLINGDGSFAQGERYDYYCLPEALYSDPIDRIGYFIGWTTWEETRLNSTVNEQTSSPEIVNGTYTRRMNLMDFYTRLHHGAHCTCDFTHKNTLTVTFDSKSEVTHLRTRRHFNDAYEIPETTGHPNNPVSMSGLNITVTRTDFEYEYTGSGSITESQVNEKWVIAGGIEALDPRLLPGPNRIYTIPRSITGDPNDAPPYEEASVYYTFKDEFDYEWMRLDASESDWNTAFNNYYPGVTVTGNMDGNWPVMYVDFSDGDHHTHPPGHNCALQRPLGPPDLDLNLSGDPGYDSDFLELTEFNRNTAIACIRDGTSLKLAGWFQRLTDGGFTTWGDGYGKVRLGHPGGTLTPEVKVKFNFGQIMPPNTTHHSGFETCITPELRFDNTCDGLGTLVNFQEAERGSSLGELFRYRPAERIDTTTSPIIRSRWRNAGSLFTEIGGDGTGGHRDSEFDCETSAFLLDQHVPDKLLHLGLEPNLKIPPFIQSVTGFYNLETLPSNFPYSTSAFFKNIRYYYNVYSFIIEINE